MIIVFFYNTPGLYLAIQSLTLGFPATLMHPIFYDISTKYKVFIAMSIGNHNNDIIFPYHFFASLSPGVRGGR
ncbi:MAG: hypothetical protein ABI707_04145 [Ferruginibacter sp.]